MKNTPNENRSSLDFAVIGGGRACKAFLQLLQQDPFSWLKIRIVGVCDINPQAEGFQLAKKLGIFTTRDYKEIFRTQKLDGLIELTDNRDVLVELIRHRPQGIGILDHNIANLLWDLFIMNQKLKSVEHQVIHERMINDFLIQQTHDRIVVLNPDYTIIEANEAYLNAVSKPKREVIGAHCFEITHGLDSPCTDSQQEIGCPMIETLRTGQTAHIIHEHATAGGKTQFCDLITYPIKNVHGEIERVIEVWRDITQALSAKWQKHVEVLQADMRKLVQEDRMISLGKLVASCVHEINNPIQGLITFADLMQAILSEDSPPKNELVQCREYLSLMAKELERCGSIISGLLSFSRESVGETKTVDLNGILRDVLDLTKHKMKLQNIRLITHFTDSPVYAKGDALQLQQCFLNLIFNAMEAMPEGGEFTVRSSIDPETHDSRICFTDTGIGIPEEYMDHIFDPFFTTKGDGRGTGLGLSITYGIVKTHGGKIEVRSRTGEGSSFILSFQAFSTNKAVL